jgi:hypothetical protein
VSDPLKLIGDTAGQGEVETGNYGDHHCKCRGRGRWWQIFLSTTLRTSSLPIRMEKLELHMTYLASSHILRTWPGIW